MKKKRTSRHFGTGRIARAYAVGIASSITIAVDKSTTKTEFENAVASESVPSVELRTSL